MVHQVNRSPLSSNDQNSIDHRAPLLYSPIQGIANNALVSIRAETTPPMPSKYTPITSVNELSHLLQAIDPKSDPTIKDITSSMSDEIAKVKKTFHPESEGSDSDIIIKFNDGDFSLSNSLKEALAKTSTFFKRLFSFPTKENNENCYPILDVSKAHFERLFRIWSGDPVTCAQEAFDLLEISNRLNLGTEPLAKVLIEVFKTWPANHEVGSSIAPSLVNQISLLESFEDVLQEIGNLLSNIYLSAYRNGNMEHAHYCLKQLKKLNIKILDLNDCDIDDQELCALIGACPKLHSLCLKNAKINDRLIEQIAKLSNLTSLDLTYCTWTVQKMEQIAKLSNLTSLDLSGCSMMADQEMDPIAKFSNLTNLNLTRCLSGSIQELEQIAKLINLTSLNLSQCRNLTDQGLEQIAKLTNLRSLNLSQCRNLTDQGMESVAKLTNLRSLNLSQCRNLTDQGLESVAKLPNLTTLNVSGCQELTDQGLESIANLSNLTYLNLSCCKPTDQGLEQIANLSNLTILDVGGCLGLTDQGRKQIAKLLNLKPNINHCNQIYWDSEAIAGADFPAI